MFVAAGAFFGGVFLAGGGSAGCWVAVSWGAGFLGRYFPAGGSCWEGVPRGNVELVEASLQGVAACRDSISGILKLHVAFGPPPGAPNLKGSCNK